MPDFAGLLDLVKDTARTLHGGTAVRDTAARRADRDSVLQRICAILRDGVPHYNWVGFYLVDAGKPRELVLGPFVGEPTGHVRIPFGRGVCGQAADRRETMVVQDVSKETNYLSCSVKVKSEIVVPLMKAGIVLGELDIDSHTPGAFMLEDERFLAAVCRVVIGMFRKP
jgi:L-methionine (R)-S-oxide reductase